MKALISSKISIKIHFFSQNGFFCLIFPITFIVTRMVFIKIMPQQLLVHKGGHINNVQLITGVRIAEMSQLQNCSVMCTKKGSYCKNEKKNERKSQGRGSGGCVQRMEVIVKRKKKLGGGGVTVDVNGEVRLL